MDEQMKSWFCAIVTECYKDHYIFPSTEWTKFPAKALKLEYRLFETKKRQVEKQSKEDPDAFHDIHFHYCPDPYRSEENLSFETESSFLETLGDFPGRKIIRSGKDLRKGLLALRWFLGAHGSHIPSAIQKQFQSIGLLIQSRRLSEWDVKHFAVQALTQYWIYKEKDFNATRMKERMLEADGHVKRLFRIGEWSCVKTVDDLTMPKDKARTFERLISGICNSPDVKENGAEAISLAGIFENVSGIRAVNFGKLETVIYYLSIALALDGLSSEAILRHSLIQSYLGRVPWVPSLHPTAIGWVRQAAKRVNFLNLKN
jgi:hypothetical protein